MPLGGYCEVCSRWVWVNGRGECQFGHPTSAVHDVQSLKPAPGSAAMVLVTPGVLGAARRDGTPAVAALGPATTAGTPTVSAPAGGASAASPRPYIGAFPPPRKRSDGRWWWRHSLWIVWTFSLGLCNWLAFLYIGMRARRWLWLLASLVYLLPIALTIAAVGSGHLGLAIGFQVFMSGVSVLHAFVARPRYRAIMFGDPPSGTAPAPPPVLVRSHRPAFPRGLDDDVAAMLRSAQTQVDEIAAVAEAVEKPNVRRKVGLLCATAEDILVELRNEPGQAPLARPFLSYYLEAANRIVGGYVELSRRGFDSPETRTTLARAEASLDSIQRAFDSQLAGLLQHQLLDLDSEIALLEKTVQMDNLMSAPVPRPDSVLKTGGAR